MDWGYITERVRRLNNLPCGISLKHDDLLYRIGSHVDVLTTEDCELIRYHQGWLTSEQRYRVLDWLTCHLAFQDKVEIKGDLALLIFGRNQLSEWLEISRQAYPDFEFYLAFEYQPASKTGWDSGINFTMFWMPLPGALVPDPETDFSWKVFWDSGDMFWGSFPNNTKNDFDFTLSVYPNQANFTIPGSVCEVGDYYTTPSDEEASLMSVAQVLEHFAVPA